MDTKHTTISPKLAIKYLRSAGKAYVAARFLEDDVCMVEVKKSSLIRVLESLGDDIEVGYYTRYDGQTIHMFFEWFS